MFSLVGPSPALLKFWRPTTMILSARIAPVRRLGRAVSWAHGILMPGGRNALMQLSSGSQPLESCVNSESNARLQVQTGRAIQLRSSRDW